MAHIGVEEGLARHLVALGEAEHLAAKGGEAAIVAVELVDQIFDLGAVELDALDLGGQLLAKLLILILFRLGIGLAGAERFEASVLELREFLEERGDVGELLERLGLQKLLHRGEGEGVVLLLIVARARRSALDQAVLVILVGFGRRVLDLFLFLEGGAGGLFGNVAVLAGFGAFDLLGRGPLESIASRSRISRSCISPSFKAFDHWMIALKVIGLSQRPQIIVSRPASIRLAIAISPSRLSNSTAPISRRYIRTGSSVRSTVSFFFSTMKRSPSPSPASSSALRARPRLRPPARPRPLPHSRRR
jgi:hypothetical protein